LSAAGDRAHIMIVLELPPNAFYNILVKLESLYGITDFAALPEDFSANTLIQFPRIVKLRLIAHPSLSRCPVAPVWPAFSDPAKSTKLIAEYFSTLR